MNLDISLEITPLGEILLVLSDTKTGEQLGKNQISKVQAEKCSDTFLNAIQIAKDIEKKENI